MNKKIVRIIYIAVLGLSTAYAEANAPVDPEITLAFHSNCGYEVDSNLHEYPEVLEAFEKHRNNYEIHVFAESLPKVWKHFTVPRLDGSKNVRFYKKGIPNPQYYRQGLIESISYSERFSAYLKSEDEKRKYLGNLTELEGLSSIENLYKQTNGQAIFTLLIPNKSPRTNSLFGMPNTPTWIHENLSYKQHDKFNLSQAIEQCKADIQTESKDINNTRIVLFFIILVSGVLGLIILFKLLKLLKFLVLKLKIIATSTKLSAVSIAKSSAVSIAKYLASLRKRRKRREIYSLVESEVIKNGIKKHFDEKDSLGDKELRKLIQESLDSNDTETTLKLIKILEEKGK